LKTSNSLHRRIKPYVTYVVKDSVLYRLESLEQFYQAQLRFDNPFVYDVFGEVNSFRIYRSSEHNQSFLIDIDFKEGDDILLKVDSLNN
jgi:hypothetical protein